MQPAESWPRPNDAWLLMQAKCLSMARALHAALAVPAADWPNASNAKKRTLPVHRAQRPGTHRPVAEFTFLDGHLFENDDVVVAFVLAQARHGFVHRGTVAFLHPREAGVRVGQHSGVFLPRVVAH